MRTCSVIMLGNIQEKCQLIFIIPMNYLIKFMVPVMHS